LEFADYRDYSAGDDLRRIDWNLYGRLDRLFLKLYEEEEDLHVMILLDHSKSMDFPRSGNGLRKFDFARRIAAALAYLALCNLDRVDLAPFASQVGANFGLSRGRGQFHNVLSYLSRCAIVDGATDMTPAFDAFTARTKWRGLAIVISDFLDPAGPAAGLGRLAHAGFEVEAIHIGSEEGDKELRGDCELVDAETGETLDVMVDERVLRHFQAAREARLMELEKFCLRSQMAFLRTHTTEPFEDLLLRRLREAGVAA
jgi:uncharacterized protein (DUF58 family)